MEKYPTECKKKSVALKILQGRSHKIIAALIDKVRIERKGVKISLIKFH